MYVVPTIFDTFTDVQMFPYRKIKTEIESPIVKCSMDVCKTENLLFGIALY